MNLNQHKDLTVEKWKKFPFYKQVLMIASELKRAHFWIKKKNLDEVKLCYERALELISITVETMLPYSSGNRLHELLRFKECLQKEYISKIFSEDRNKNLFFTLISLSPQSYNLLNSNSKSQP